VTGRPEPTVETPRLRLRQFVEDDLDEYARITADPEVMRYVGGTPYTREEAWRSLGYILGHWKIRGFGLWAVEERSSGALIGRIGLYHPEGWPGLEVGWLVARSRWEEGFATEGGSAAMRYAFQALDAAHLISVIEPRNAASIRVAEKLGERFEKKLQLQGKSVLVFGIARARWEAIHTSEGERT
jgi:RimJ/RimL family protein N-acetyltransferase